jgi:hypothetical protein
VRALGSAVAILTAVVLPAALLSGPMPAASAATNAPDLGHGSVLFIDSHRVEAFSNAQRSYVTGKKVVVSSSRPGQVSIKPVLTYPVKNLLGQEAVYRDKNVDGHRDIDSNALFGVASVIPDRRASGATFYRMYLRSGGNVGYRESSDGINWRPLADPDKLIVIPRMHPMSVFRDSNGAYVLAGWRRAEKNSFGAVTKKAGYVVMRSSNGIDFTEVSYSGPLADLPGDVIQAAADPLNGWKYAVAKRAVHLGPSCGSGVRAGGRAFATYSATNILNWSGASNLLSSDCTDALSVPPVEGTTRPMHVYGAPFTRYGDQFVSFPWLFQITRNDSADSGKSDGPVDSQVASTPNVRTTPWRRADANRVVNGRNARPVLIRRGAAGSWDDGMLYASAPIVNFGGRSHVYYTGWNATHTPVDGRRARPGMASWRRDGFVGLKSRTADPARIRTRAFELASGATRDLTVNAALGDSGWMRVGVIDAATGAYLPGWRLEDSTTVRGDGLDSVVRWGGKRLGQLRDRPIKLVFQFDGPGATFYAYRVH